MEGYKETYDEMCNQLLNLIEDNKIKEKAKRILYEGKIDDSTEVHVEEFPMKYNSELDQARRYSMAYLLASTPETFETLMKNNIRIFHGTNANALPGILKYGLNSVDESNEKGIRVITGEEGSRFDGRDFISVTDDLYTALNYAGIEPNREAKKDLSFGIIVGMSVDDIKNASWSAVGSDLPEVGIRKNLPLECIKVLGVPSNKVKFVQKMVGEKQIMVLPMEMEKFYYVDLPHIGFDPEKFKELATKRKRSGISNVYNEIKEKILMKDIW